jgi:hypothetical protein
MQTVDTSTRGVCQAARREAAASNTPEASQGSSPAGPWLYPRAIEGGRIPSQGLIGPVGAQHELDKRGSPRSFSYL